MTPETLSVRYVRLLLDVAEREGVSRGCFLAAAGWEPERVNDVEGRIPARELYRLCELALDLTGEPMLGLLMLKRVRPQSVDLMGQLVAHASDVRQALESHLQLQKLAGDASRYSLLEDEQGVTLRYRCPTEASPRVRRFLAEMHISGAYRLIQYFARGARPIEVEFEHPPPPYAQEYRRVFKGVERFGRSATAILFDREAMTASRSLKDEELHRALRDLAQMRIARLERGVSCAERVRRILNAAEGPGKVQMATMAREIGMSQRSLRRRLAAEGTSFDAVVDGTLAEKASHLLSVERRTIQETAFALGYSDTTAFHRAFKRWTGTTPKAWLAARPAE